jgi:hypothetical protein
MVYLAVQAVEYESQTSTSLRAKVLSATSPVQLDEVMQQLDTVWGPRSTNRARAQMVPYIFNLRDQTDGAAPQSSLLSIDARGATGSGPGTANIPRFQEMLTSPDYAVYDDRGNYQGQGIPFSITRDKVSITGDALALSCGERLWRVAALISSGSQSLFQSTHVSLELRKGTAFYSQKCDANGDSSHYQVAGIIPGNNPFAGTTDGSVSGNTTRYMATSVEADRFGSENELISTIPNEANGVDYSDTFADWGLFGDYMLVFRSEGPLALGFDLSQVTQVQLAFYTLRVDNSLNPPPASTPLVP